MFDDQRFDTSGTSWTLTPLSGCAGQWDVQSVATHEHGHAAGMEHANEVDHPWLTMSTAINGTCQQSERTFAFGEANAWNVFLMNRSHRVQHGRQQAGRPSRLDIL